MVIIGLEPLKNCLLQSLLCRFWHIYENFLFDIKKDAVNF